MIAAVLDTNVLASGFVRTHTAPGQVLERWRADRFTLICSQVIYLELVRTLQSPYFTQRLSAEEILANLQLLARARFATLPERTIAGVATHPEDDLILATAVAGNCWRWGRTRAPVLSARLSCSRYSIAAPRATSCTVSTQLSHSVNKRTLVVIEPIAERERASADVRDRTFPPCDPGAAASNVEGQSVGEPQQS